MGFGDGFYMSWTDVKDDNVWLVHLDGWWCHTLEKEHQGWWEVTRFGGKIKSSVYFCYAAFYALLK